MKQNLFAALPAMNTLMQSPAVNTLCQQYGYSLVKHTVQSVLAHWRSQIKAGDETEPTLDLLVQQIQTAVHEKGDMSLRHVVNATGVVLHTNLGRAVLSPAIRDTFEQVAFGYSNLEYNLAEKQRGQRYHHTERLLQEITGAESVLVVNNNAAAVMLVLDTMVQQQEVIVSRGELVEIGDSFRIPDIITRGGGILKEVGATNKTHLYDYERAINETTGAVLKVHTSNYRMVGFAESVATADLSKLAHAHHLPLINDLGSGLLVDLQPYGLPAEPLIKEELKYADVVTFSGDKLLGGPQAGIIAGKKEYVDQMKHNQLTRALRVDKLTLTALEATLHLYQNPDKLLENVPTLRMITQSEATLANHAVDFMQRLLELPTLQVSHIKGESQVGGGSFPGYTLPTYLVTVTTPLYSATKLEEALRLGKPAIVARVENDQLQFDVRTLTEADDELIIQRLKELVSRDA
jgi:L-seryl-tRNA(Ser) seleniumtransferase